VLPTNDHSKTLVLFHKALWLSQQGHFGPAENLLLTCSEHKDHNLSLSFFSLFLLYLKTKR
jgi:hypothetical protein